MPTLSPQTTPFYGGGQVANPANVIQTSGVPSTKLTEDKLGTLSINNATGDVYCLASKSGGTNTWQVLGGGTSDVNTVSGNTGGQLSPTGGNISIIGSGALAFAGSGSTLTGTITPGTALLATLTGDSGTATPSAGNIQLIGGTGIVTVASGATVTFNLEGGSVAMDSFTPDAGTSPVVPTALGLVTMAGTANQITTTGGTNVLTFSIPSAFTAPGSVTTTTSLTAGNAFSVTTGVITMASGTSAINISADAAATTINLGTGAGVKALTLGSTNGASASVLQSGPSGSISVSSNGGSLNLLSGTGATNISADAAATNVNIGTGGAIKAITIGSTNSSSSATVLCGSTGFIAVNSGGGTLSILAGTGTMNIAADATAGAVNVATGAGVKVLTVGSSNATSSTTLQSGTGALAVTSAGGTLTINSGTGALSLSNDAAATTVSIGTGAAVKGVTLGSTSSTSATTVQAGTGALNLLSLGGAITANSGVGAIGISTDVAATTVSIGTGGAAKSVTLGSTTTTSATTINSGSGNLTMVGNVLKTTNPAFLAYLGATVNDKTGNGASYLLGTDALTEVYDRGNNFNTNGVFTAPVTGIYDLRASITVSGTTIATSFTINLITTARTYTYVLTRAALGTNQAVSISALCDMASGNSATVSIVVSGEAGDTDDIAGSASCVTYFCGALVA